MEIVGVILVIVLIVLAFSALGWVMKVFGWIFDFIGEGCSTSWGCLIWIFAIIIGLLAVL